MQPTTNNRAPFTSRRLSIGRSQTEAPYPLADLRPEARPVSLIVHRQVEPACQAAFTGALCTFLDFAMTFPGHLDVHVLRRTQGGNESYAIAHRFANARTREQFTSSIEFRVWRRQLKVLTQEIPEFSPTTEPEEKATEEITAVLGGSKFWTIGGALVFMGLLGVFPMLPVINSMWLQGWHPLARSVIVGGLLAALLAWLGWTCAGPKKTDAG